jgi:hypothetical protein
MNPMHEANVDELIKDMAKVLKANCVRLYKSGALDIESYDVSGFALAKILLTASMEQCKDQSYPFTDTFRKDVENLLHF